jgi:hypothetical protein
MPIRKLLLLLLHTPTFLLAQVGVGTTSPHGSARLQVEASASGNAKGFLPPRVALQGTNDAQLVTPFTPTIASPATGLLVYNTAVAGSGATAVAPGFYFYNGSGWVRLITPSESESGYVTLSTGQTISGAKVFSSDITVNSVRVGRGAGNVDQNVAIGADALASGTGTRNTAVGYGAMRSYSGTGFDNNSSLGYFTMSSLTTGSGNTGNQSLLQNTGSNNVGIGKGAGQTIVTGSNNTIIGTEADVSTATFGLINNATAIGYQASVDASNKIQLGNNSVTAVNTSGTITANGFVKSGGTSTQFLMANGSATASPSLSSATSLPLTTGVTGVLPVTNGGTGVTTSTGTGSVVLSTTPSLTTPSLGVATAASINKVVITAPATSATLTIADGKTLTASNSISMAGTDGTTMTFPSTSATIARTDAGQTFSGTQSFSGVVSVSNSTASTSTSTGALVITGGVGVGGALYSGPAVPTSLTTPSVATSTITAISSPGSLTYKTAASSGADHIFQVNGSTEAMRILNNGNIGVGTNSPNTALHIQNGNSIGSGDPSSNSVPSLYVYNNNNSSSTAHAIVAVRTGGSTGGKPYISFDAASHSGFSIGLNNPSDQFIINTDWNFNVSNAARNALIINETGQARVIIPNSGGTHMGDFPAGWGGGLSIYDMSCSGVYYNTLLQRSDERLKNSVKSLDGDAIRKYLQLNPVSYFWNKGKSSDDKLQYGLIAQQVEKIFPEMVFTASDNVQTKSVNYQALHALSLKVIQSQQYEIEMLKKKQEDVESRLMKLESKFK